SFVITTSSLPVATQGTAYSVTLAASGGTQPYTWSLSSGTLPAGLGLAAATGVISGTPGGTGLSSFTVQVKDSAGSPLSAFRPLAISVTTTGAQYDPPSSGIAPTTTITFTYNDGQTSAPNRSSLLAATTALLP